MTIQDLITQLSKYPNSLELSEIKVTLGIELEPRMGRIQSAYLADQRIAGGHPWGCLQHRERQTNLASISTALLHGLKMSRK